jgi:hypothetical protein
MLPGFKTRLLEELKHTMKTHDKFAELRQHVDIVAIPDCVMAPNIC